MTKAVRIAPCCPRCKVPLVGDDAARRWQCVQCASAWSYGPTAAWFPLRYHAEQRRLWLSKARYKVIGAGRRSGKSAVAKRAGVKAALRNKLGVPDYRVSFCAPTHTQAKKIYWNDLKAMVPRALMAGPPRESELYIQLVNGAMIEVLGMNEPARAEGRPMDWCGWDEAGDQKKGAFWRHIYPALQERDGEAWIYGATRPGGDFREMKEMALDPAHPEWEWFTWKSDTILPPEVIAEAKRTLDPLTYAQEMDAQFVNFEGRVYYQFDRALHGVEPLHYNKALDLILTFDFNQKPGTANVIQEQTYEGRNKLVAEIFTAVLDEVHIKSNSNTPMVCREILRRYGKHPGRVRCYGDFSGGSRMSSSVAGSDWDLIKGMLGRVFKERLYVFNDVKNPSHVVRVNALNSRLRSIGGVVSMLVDPRCKETIRDYEEVAWRDGVREIDKDRDEARTHHSDGVDYYVWRAHPIVEQFETVEAISDYASDDGW